MYPDPNVVLVPDPRHETRLPPTRVDRVRRLRRHGKVGRVVDEPKVTKVTADQLHVAADGDSAATLADLTSVRKDVEEAQTYVRQLQAMPASTHTSSEHQVMRPALWKAVAISYRRAFTTGKSFAKGRSRSRYPSEIIESLNDADRATHEAILEDADRHIAHRVDDDREEAKIKVVLNPPHNPGVAGVSRSGHRFGGARDDLVLAVDPLCNRLLDELDGEINRLGDEVRAHAERELTALYEKAGLAQLLPPEPH